MYKAPITGVMMARTIEFKVVDKRFYKMTQEQRIAALDKIFEQAEKARRENAWSEDGINAADPFPPFIQKLMAKVAKWAGWSITYDNDNGIYVLHDYRVMPSGWMRKLIFRIQSLFIRHKSADDICTRFRLMWDAHLRANPDDAAKWGAEDSDYHLSMSVMTEDEAQAMAQLEAALGGRPQNQDKK